jgi:hypothetical protein
MVLIIIIKILFMLMVAINPGLLLAIWKARTIIMKAASRSLARRADRSKEILTNTWLRINSNLPILKLKSCLLLVWRMYWRVFMQGAAIAIK